MMRPRSVGVTSIVRRAVKSPSELRLIDGSGVRTHASGSPGRAAKPRLELCSVIARAPRPHERTPRSRGCDAGLVELGDETAGLRRIGEGDALTDARGEHGRVVLGERLGRLSGDDRAYRTAVEHEAGDKLRTEDARLIN